MLQSGLNISEEYQIAKYDMPAIEEDLKKIKELLKGHLSAERNKLLSEDTYSIDLINKYDEEIYYLRVIDFLLDPEIYKTQMGHKEIYGLAKYVNSLYKDKLIPTE